MKKLPIVIAILIFVVGIGLLAYPLVSSVVNNVAARQKAETYIQKAKDTDTAEIDAQFEVAENYNASLNRVILTDPFDEESYGLIGENYEKALWLDDNGLIGYVEIPKIDVYLPIYHGTSLDILSLGAGHLEHTSLPIGGEGTHSVISAHSGYPSETFFDYLPDLGIGDEFYIHVLNRTLRYQVDDINVVTPDDTSKLYCEDGKDYVTLLTCTPYSVNTHRLLVRGSRVPYEVADDNVDRTSTVTRSEGAVFFLGYKLSYLTIGLCIGGFVLTVALVVFVIIWRRRRKRRGETR